MSETTLIDADVESTQADTAQPTDQQEVKSDLLSNAETTETTEGQKPEEAKEEVKEEGAPEKYEFKPLEGHEFDPVVLDAYSAAAKKLNLTQEKAQSVLDEMAPVMKAQQEARLVQMQKEWQTAAHADKEYGGDKWEENMGIAGKAFNKFASPELRDIFDKSGLHHNPEIIRTFYRIGKAISEDKFVGGGSGEQPKNRLDVLYDKS